VAQLDWVNLVTYKLHHVDVALMHNNLIICFEEHLLQLSGWGYYRWCFSLLEYIDWKMKRETELVPLSRIYEIIAQGGLGMMV